MRVDLTFVARVYCGLAAAALIGLGLAAWSAARDNVTIGALLCGVGLFLLAGLFGSRTRLVALTGLCGCFFVLAFVIDAAGLLLHRAAPTASTLTLWCAELAAAALAAWLARRLYRAAIG